MIKGLEKVDGVEDAVIHRGDPRLPKEGIDPWLSGLLTSVEVASSRPYLYGSDAGLCARKNIFYEWNTWISEAKSATTTAYMAIGVGLENMLAEGLKKAGRLVRQDTRIVQMDELKISGKIDLIIFDQEDELAIVEIKTCGILPSRPDPKHLAQVQIYCAVSGIHKAWLTYISRTVRAEYGPELAIRSFAVDTGREALKHRLAVAGLSASGSKLGKVPSVNPAFRKTVECRYCPFLDFCWELEPRYRKGSGDGPKSPLPQLSISEQLRLETVANRLADSLMDDSEIRWVLSLRGLILSEDVSAVSKKGLVDLLKLRGY